MDSQLIAYFVFTTLLVVTPGSTTAVVVRNVLDSGCRAGLAAAAGAALGNTSYATARRALETLTGLALLALALRVARG